MVKWRESMLTARQLIRYLCHFLVVWLFCSTGLDVWRLAFENRETAVAFLRLLGNEYFAGMLGLVFGGGGVAASAAMAAAGKRQREQHLQQVKDLREHIADLKQQLADPSKVKRGR